MPHIFVGRFACFPSRRITASMLVFSTLCAKEESLMSRSALAEKHPWTLPWWKAEGENFWVMIYIVTVHLLAVTGLILFPLPGWKVFLLASLMACAGGLGTTVGYHR